MCIVKHRAMFMRWHTQCGLGVIQLYLICVQFGSRWVCVSLCQMTWGLFGFSTCQSFLTGALPATWSWSSSHSSRWPSVIPCVITSAFFHVCSVVQLYSMCDKLFSFIPCVINCSAFFHVCWVIQLYSMCYQFFSFTPCVLSVDQLHPSCIQLYSVCVQLFSFIPCMISYWALFHVWEEIFSFIPCVRRDIQLYSMCEKRYWALFHACLVIQLHSMCVISYPAIFHVCVQLFSFIPHVWSVIQLYSMCGRRELTTSNEMIRRSTRREPLLLSVMFERPLRVSQKNKDNPHIGTEN